jgi:hypothetical protein
MSAALKLKNHAPETHLRRLQRFLGISNFQIKLVLFVCIRVLNNMDLYEKEAPDVDLLIEDIKAPANQRKSNNKINRCQNISVYERHKRSPKIRARINDIFVKHISYLDVTLEEFLNGFPGNYRQRLCELVMSDFFDSAKSFRLKERSIEDKSRKDGKLTDLEFEHNQKKYLVEITTRKSSLIPDYYLKSLPEFNRYFPIAKIFQKENERDKKKYNRTRYNWEYGAGKQMGVWTVLGQKEKEIILRKLALPIDTKKLSKNDLEGFNCWLREQQYAMFHFEELLPDDVLLELKNLGIDWLYLWRGEEDALFYEMLTKFIAQEILEKLKKGYFSLGDPIILAVSLALMDDVKMLCDTKKLIRHIAKSLSLLLKQVAEEKNISPEKIKYFQSRLQGLYAVVIDTTRDNWFPETPGAQIPEGQSNYYGVIYNANLSEDIRLKSDDRIFDEVILYSHELHLQI